ncbi:MAG: sulfite exporter TauE/SafE family protein [Holophagales bacterium]|nr:sulfite exporter TauE/SafE family protein [Holophagales bacterium]
MILAWLGAISIGLSLGLLGSGGSILTVPILVYVVGEPEKVAIAESLAIVGLIALAGAIPYSRQKLVDWRTVGLFGIPGMLGAWIGAVMARYVSGQMQLAIFAVVMLLAAVMMFRPPKLGQARAPRALWKIVLDGLVVGALTGFVGVGGGFLIVPALVLLGGLPMHRAVGTSLAIIALKSATGYVKYLQVLHELQMDVRWDLIAVFSVLGVGGSWLGRRLARRLPQARLRRIFAVFLVLMGVFILYRNLHELIPG